MEENIKNNENIEQVNEENKNLPEILPVLVRNDVIIYPLLILPVAINDPNQIKLIDDSLSQNKLIILGYTKKDNLSNITSKDIEEFGVVANIMKMLRFPDGSVRILLQGIKRTKIEEIVTNDKPYFLAKYKQIEEVESNTITYQAFIRNLKDQFKNYIKISQQFPEEIFQILDTIQEGWKLADFIASNLPIDVNTRYEILTIKNSTKRMERVSEILAKETSIIELGQKIKSKVTSEINEDQKKFFLREQLKAIKEELGEEDPKDKEINELREKLKKKKMSQNVFEIVEKEIEKLEMMNPLMPDYNVSRTYLDWILELPWN